MRNNKKELAEEPTMGDLMILRTVKLKFTEGTIERRDIEDAQRLSSPSVRPFYDGLIKACEIMWAQQKEEKETT